MQRTFLAARRGHCRTGRRPAATHLPAAKIVTCSAVTSGCRLGPLARHAQSQPVPRFTGASRPRRARARCQTRPARTLQSQLEDARFADLKSYHYRAMTCERGSAEIITVAGQPHLAARPVPFPCRPRRRVPARPSRRPGLTRRARLPHPGKQAAGPSPRIDGPGMTTRFSRRTRPG